MYSYNRPLSVISFANIFSPWLLFSFFINRVFGIGNLNFNEVQIIDYLSWIVPLLLYLQTTSPHPFRFTTVLPSIYFIAVEFLLIPVLLFKLLFVKSIKFLSLCFCACTQGCLIFIAPFVEKTMFVPLYCHCSFAHLTVFLWVSFWSIWLIL